jgi:hypothetical protein
MNLLALAAFATIDESAIDALKHAAATCDPHYECGGVVRKVAGGFQASRLVTSTKPFSVNLELLYDSDVVADFHTHICSIHNRPFADFFSTSDALVNQGLHTVGYMLSLCDRNIRRYDPSQDDRDDEEVDFHSGRVIYLTSGHIVGWAPPVPPTPEPAEETRLAAAASTTLQARAAPGLGDEQPGPTPPESSCADGAKPRPAKPVSIGTLTASLTRPTRTSAPGARSASASRARSEYHRARTIVHVSTIEHPTDCLRPGVTDSHQP